jgi:glycerophosphoryl diester phosphodiesterase
MVIHDATLERTTNGRGNVRDCSAEELRRLKIRMSGGMGEGGNGGSAEWIPTLEEVMGAVPARVGLVIELKAAGTAAPVVALVRKLRALERATIISFDLDLLREVRGVEKRIALGALWSKPPRDAVAQAKSLGAGMIDVNHRHVTARLVERAHAENLKCVVWTVNQVSEMRRMVKLGVDGITTDFPDKAMKGEGGGLKPET